MAAAQAGDPATLAAVLRSQRVHLLTELRSLAEARVAASGSPVVTLLVKAGPRQPAPTRHPGTGRSDKNSPNGLMRPRTLPLLRVAAISVS
jgi:hypothetical protein